MITDLLFVICDFRFLLGGAVPGAVMNASSR